MELIAPIRAGDDLAGAAFEPSAGGQFFDAFDERVRAGNVVERQVIAEGFGGNAARNIGMFEDGF